MAVAYRRRDGFDENELLLLSIIAYVYLFFTALDNKDPRYTMPFLPAFLVFAAFAVDRIGELDALSSKTAPVAINVLLVVTAGGAVAEAAPGITQPAPDAETDTVATLIDDRSSAAVHVENQTGWVSGEAVTFYVLARDPGLQRSVGYSSRDSVDWIVSAEPVDDRRFELYRRVGDRDRAYTYQRTRANETPSRNVRRSPPRNPTAPVW
jgi:hypothetical protein